MSRRSLDFQYSLSRKISRKQSKLPSMPSTKDRQIPRSATSCQKVYQPNVEEMKRVFDKFDSNRDGRISVEEYRSAARTLLGKGAGEPELIKAFRMADADGDGSIDFKEFMEMQNVGGGIKSSDIEGAFHIYDLNGDGKISAEELWDVMKKLGEKCSLDACRKMVREVDCDGDGCVNIHEFTNMMTRTLKLSR
ncbi:calmodulin-like protein 1 [Punica granatum]|uniref:EF-hand domain-containing protein n=2 Tax=Punica granatum TaxID=22663 RepID=A0A218X626_PUNGR|nr:calmodulin-like protein 1 [Punica granatum]OWM80407.1 hypothetical protein CDL15_Pgr019687 [Punica granatum]PKI52869.1 hypothetical protein CRG98_026700 [Punica granatum]